MSVIGTPKAQGLIGRVTGLLMRPKVEWELIAPETATTQGLFMGYAVILAALPAIAQIIHGFMPSCFSFFIVSGCVTANPIYVVAGGVVQYVTQLAAVFVIGFIIDALAPSFGGERSQIQGMKVAVYSWTAAWLAGVLIIIPWFGALLSLIGVYSVYLLYTGLPVLMKSPPDKSIAYTAVVVVLGLVAAIIIGSVAGGIAAIGRMGGAINGAPATVSGTVNVGGSSIDLGKLQQAGQALQQQAQAARQAAQNGGNPASAGQIVAVDPAKLKALLPDTVAGLARKNLNTTTAGNQAFSNIEAIYGTGSTTVTITITDLGVASPLAALAGAVNVNEDDESASGYDRVQTINGRLTETKYDNPSKSGEYSVVVANRFKIEAQGAGVPIDTLTGAVNAVGPDRVQALAQTH